MRVRVGSGAEVAGGVAFWGEEPLLARTLPWWEAEPLRCVWDED